MALPEDDSILNTVKKILGLDPTGYTAFDTDIITYINSAFSVMAQLGVGPPGGFMIEDSAPKWADLTYVNPVSLTTLPVPPDLLNMIKTYIYLRVRRLFDPASTRFVIEAINEQITEHEWRLKQYIDNLTPVTKPAPIVEYIDIFTGSEVTIE